jgi:Leucine-rich repeat (LRR) protein
LEKVTNLTLSFNKLTEVPKGLEKLTQLEILELENNPALTKAQIEKLQMALPKCKIEHNAK